MTHEVARMSFSPYKYEPDSGLPNCTWLCGIRPPQTRRWSESSWDGLDVETEGHRMRELVRLRDIFAEHAQPN